MKRRIFKPLFVLWTLPNTILGCVFGVVGLAFGGKVQIKRGAIEFYSGGTKWIMQHLLPNGQFVLAITLGHSILGQTEAALDISRDHEHVHVRQYERWGPLFIPAYFIASFIAWMQGKDPYRGNSFEVEAYGQEPIGE